VFGAFPDSQHRVVCVAEPPCPSARTST
jgi:hypothetical protein